MGFLQFSKNPAFAKALADKSAGKQKFYIISLVILISALFFLVGAFSVSAAECGNNQEVFSFASFLNPVASLAEKAIVLNAHYNS